MTNQKFRITNLTCAACVKLSTMALKKIPGLGDVAIDLASGTTEITSDREVAWEEIVDALKTVEKTAAQIT